MKLKKLLRLDLENKEMEQFVFLKNKILNEWDPIGIKSLFSDVDQNDNEYDRYLNNILHLLKNSDLSEEELFKYLWQIETEYIGLKGNKLKTKTFSAKLIKDFTYRFHAH